MALGRRGRCMTRLLVEVHIAAADAHSAHLHPHMPCRDVCWDVVVLIAEVISAVQDCSRIFQAGLFLDCEHTERIHITMKHVLTLSSTRESASITSSVHAMQYTCPISLRRRA